MILKHTFLYALLVGAVATACSSTSATVTVEEPEASFEPIAPAYAPSGDAYTVVLMRTGDELHVPSGVELKTLTDEHRAFMREMGDGGYMLASGPIVPPRAEPEMRAMFFVDSEDPVAAYERTCSNPASEAGLYEMEAMGFVTEANLRALTAMDRTLRMERSSGIGIRPYIVVTAPTSAAMTAIFGQMEDVVLFCGHCTSGTFEGMSMAFLDCSTINEARQVMSAAGPQTQGFGYHAWIASVSIAALD